jgi:hypothetical protein
MAEWRDQHDRLDLRLPIKCSMKCSSENNIEWNDSALKI